MEVNSFFITEDLFDLIFLILPYEDKINFSQITQFTYNTYYHGIRYTIYKSVNNDYQLFKRCFQRFAYTEEEIQEIGVTAVKGVNSVWDISERGYYDLRYLFELIYRGLNIDKEIIQNTKYSNLQIIMKKIKQCLSFTRSETIHKVNNEVMLYSLHTSFTPIVKRSINKSIKNKSHIQGTWEKI